MSAWRNPEVELQRANWRKWADLNRRLMSWAIRLAIFWSALAWATDWAAARSIGALAFAVTFVGGMILHHRAEVSYARLDGLTSAELWQRRQNIAQLERIMRDPGPPPPTKAPN